MVRKDQSHSPDMRAAMRGAPGLKWARPSWLALEKNRDATRERYRQQSRRPEGRGLSPRADRLNQT